MIRGGTSNSGQRLHVLFAAFRIRFNAMAALFLALSAALLLPRFAAAAGDNILIVADEMPQMELLARVLNERTGTQARIVTQENMPPDLGNYPTVVVFIHFALQEAVEKKLVDYAEKGRRLLLLHHSISQGKRTNKYWFPALGVNLTPGDPEQGHYKWIEGVTYQLVNLAPGHYITSHNVKYRGTTRYKRSDTNTPEMEYPAFGLNDSEVFLNHQFTDGDQKTVLLGFKWTDPKTGKVWMQDRAGWYKRSGKGWIIYLQPGHAVSDLEHPVYSQIVLNALTAELK